MKKIISDCSTGIVSVIEFTDIEVAEIEAMRSARVNLRVNTTLTKEQLLVELAALTAKIQALT